MIDWAREFSTSPPRTIPIIIGAGENPDLLKKNPTTPDISIIYTSTIDWDSPYEPTKQNIKTDGHKKPLGINEILEKILAPINPNIKKMKFAKNIA